MNHSFATDIGWYGATDGDALHPDTFYATPLGGSLYRIDVVAKTATAVGSYGGVPITGLAYDEVHNILYATDYSNLYTINTTSGTPTLIGSLGGPRSAWAFDYDASIDELVAVCQTSYGSAMYYIDRNNGSASYIGYTSQRRITDIWYDSDDGQMYGVGNDPFNTGVGKLYRLNSSTSEAFELGNFEEDLLGLGAPIPGVHTPEPMTVAFLALGSLSLLRAKDHKA